MKTESISRRDALRGISLLTGGLLLSGGVLSQGCSRRAKPYVVDRLPRARNFHRFTPVDVAAERIIRTTVGLRPFRPSGFVVKAESLGDKVLVHNYGHGGGGVTLSWGTSTLAADLVAESGRSGPAAVVGCGAVGSQQRGFYRGAGST